VRVGAHALGDDDAIVAASQRSDNIGAACRSL
jgi:hypothetical protein